MCTNFDKIVRELKEQGVVEGLEIGEKRGVAIGKQQERLSEKLRTIERLNSAGIEITTIAIATGLSIAEVRNLMHTH